MIYPFITNWTLPIHGPNWRRFEIFVQLWSNVLSFKPLCLNSESDKFLKYVNLFRRQAQTELSVWQD